jgi:hypothetical protein
MLASTELFVESVIDSLILSDKIGMHLPRTFGRVSASITCTVIVYFCTGVFLVLTDAPFSPTDVLRCLVCRVCCFEVAGRSSGLSGVRLLLGLPGVSSVFSDGNSDCLWFISTSTFELFTFVGAAIFVYIYKPVR